LSAADISGGMLARTNYNLNALAHDTTINLIKKALADGANVTDVYVDTVGKPAIYQEKLQRIFPDLKITVESKADATYPIVSAASICAKVTRDLVISAWRHIEKVDVPVAFGSGYPSDPNTKAWLRANIDPIFGFTGERAGGRDACGSRLGQNILMVLFLFSQGLVRFSWSTASTLLKEHAKVQGAETCARN
jgi:ribonuclease H2 subunit A